MDALTDIVRLLRPHTVLLGSMTASGNWAVRVPPQPAPTFYLVTEGDCWYRHGDADPVELHPGDYLLSVRPEADAFLSAPDGRPVLSDDAFKARHWVDGEVRLGGGDAPTRVLGGLLACDAANADLLVELLPRLVHVRASDAGGARLRTVVTLLREEAEDDRPGRDAILARLIEVMLIETLRREAEALPAAGLLGGLADPRLARALTQIHADVGRGWTIAELGREAGMSRSVFARRFAEAVGVAPVEYLLRWRMALAKDALANSRTGLDEIAAKVGYKSASAFSTAFSQRIGMAPSLYAQSLRAGQPAAG